MKDFEIQTGDVVLVGANSSKMCGVPEGTELKFVDGYFDYDNGLYTETQSAPSIWDEERKEFDSCYHIFGNDYEYFLDSKIVSGPSLAT